MTTEIQFRAYQGNHADTPDNQHQWQFSRAEGSCHHCSKYGPVIEIKTVGGAVEDREVECDECDNDCVPVELEIEIESACRVCLACLGGVIG